MNKIQPAPGFSTPINEKSRNSFDIRAYILPFPRSSLIISVKSEDLIESGIFPGDKLVIRQSSDIKNGDLVMVKVDGKYLIRYYKKVAGVISLNTGVPPYRKTQAQNNLELIGIVESLMRKYM